MHILFKKFPKTIISKLINVANIVEYYQETIIKLSPNENILIIVLEGKIKRDDTLYQNGDSVGSEML